MTARELYEFALIELNKLEAQSLLLEDYNYFINKAVQQYINKVYNRYDINQQSTDDLRVLKTTTVVPLTKLDNTVGIKLDKTYGGILPKDYLHILNCVIEYQVLVENFKCYDVGENVYFGARRLTSDMYPQIINNAYMRPMYKRPYYFINNINTANAVVTNPSMDAEVTGASRTKAANDRTSNISQVRLEVRYGRDDTEFKAIKAYVDYIKSPMFIRLTQTQIDNTLDTSQVLEFPDYVCHEIVNEFTKLLLENASDPRIQTNIPVNQTIATNFGEQE